MTRIYCNRKDDMHVFYIKLDQQDYYLFSQKYRAGVDRFYKNGVPLDKGIRHGIGKTDYALHQTIDKIKRHIRYIEKEYAVEILNRTKLKAAA